MEKLKELGKIFEDARTSKGLTIEAVTKKTRIHGKILESLERGVPDPKLNKIYVRSFAKKYADFLGLDTSSILPKYLEPVVRSELDQKLFIKPKEEASPSKPGSDVVPVILAGAAIVLIAAMLVFGLVKAGQVISKFMPKGGKKSTQVKPKAAVKTEKRTVIADKQAQSQLRDANAALNLSVRTTSDVWVSVQKDGTAVFTGILKNGSSERWAADKALVLRVGKLQAMEFVFNGQNLGKIGNGVRKLTFDKDGIKIGDRKYEPQE